MRLIRSAMLATTALVLWGAVGFAQSQRPTEPIVLAISAGNALDEQMALAIARNFEQIGVPTEIQVVDRSTLLARARRAATEGETWSEGGYDIFFIDLSGTAYEPSGLARYFHTNSRAAFNVWNIYNDELDEQLELAGTSTDPDERAEHYSNALRIMQDEMPVVNLFHPLRTYVLRAGWEGIEPYRVNQPIASPSFWQMTYQGQPAAELRVATPSDVRSLNPLFDWTGPGKSMVGSLVYDSLVMLDDQHMPTVPALAESWEYTDDGTTLTFHLRQDVTWHDGTPFTSADVKFSFDTRMNPEAGAELGSNFQAVSEVTTPDEHTVVVTLEQPSGAALFEIGLTEIAPQHVFEGLEASEIATAPHSTGDALIPGTGPYRIVSWNRGQQLVLEANDDYFRGEPTVDRITWRTIPDGSTAIAALRSGEVDVLDYGYAFTRELESLERDPNIQVFSYDSLTTTVMGFNQEHPFLSSTCVRQALAKAVPKEHIAENLARGLATPATQFLPPSSWAHDSELTGAIYDLEAAGEMLDGCAAGD